MRGAETGQLTAMVGGDPSVFEQALPLLRCIAARVHYLGAAGSGTVAKLTNQSIYLSYVAVFCEATRLARDAGLDVSALFEVLRTSLAGQPLLTGWDRQIASGDKNPVFPIREVLRDLSLAERLWHTADADTPLLDACLDVYRQAAKAGLDDEDMTALFGTAREISHRDQG